MCKVGRVAIQASRKPGSGLVGAHTRGDVINPLGTFILKQGLRLILDLRMSLH